MTLNDRFQLWLVFLSTMCAHGCVQPYRTTCVDGDLQTAGHNVNRDEPVVTLAECSEWSCRRTPVDGEPVLVNGRTGYNVFASDWGGWVLLDQSCVPGDSGGAVTTLDGCLIGIPVENHSGQCWAWGAS